MTPPEGWVQVTVVSGALREDSTNYPASSSCRARLGPQQYGCFLAGFLGLTGISGLPVTEGALGPQDKFCDDLEHPREGLSENGVWLVFKLEKKWH